MKISCCPAAGRVLRTGLLVAAVTCGLLAAKSALADSPMYRGGPSLSGSYADKLTLPVSLAWKHTTAYSPYNTSSPAVVGKVAYYADAHRVYAINANSGALIWRYPEDGPLETVVNTSPAVSDGVVFFGSVNGELTAVDASDGHKLWTFITKSIISASPIVHEGVVYFGSANGKLYAVDTKTHLEVGPWKGGVQLSDEISGTPAIGNDNVYVITLDSVIHAIGVATGKERAAVRLSGATMHMSPVVTPDFVYAAAGSNVYYLMSRNLSPRRTTQLPAEVSASPTVTEDGVYVVGRDGQVVGLDPRTAKVKWKQIPKIDFDVTAAPAVSGKTLFIGTARGGIYGIDTDSGEVKWSYKMVPATNREDTVPIATNIAASPVIANNTLYMVSDDGSLVAFRSDALDTAAPTYTDLELPTGIVPNSTNAPTTMAINGSPPLYFEATLEDEGSGVNPSSLKLMMDGQPLAKRPDGDANRDKPGWEYEASTGKLKYKTPTPTSASVVDALRDGRHTITLVATDWAGNTLNKTWTFTVDNSLKQLARKTRGGTTPTNRPGGLGSGGAGAGGKGGP